jgi:hypothetical protein
MPSPLPQESPLWPACKSQHSFAAQIKKLSPQPTLVMEVDTGLAPNAVCAYERTARAAGNDILNSKVKIQKPKKGIGH